MPETQPVQITDQSPFICDCQQLHQLACRREDFYAELEGKRYCILHYPATKDQQLFNAAIKRKLDAEEFDFSGVYFEGFVTFRLVEFSTDADFSATTFKNNADFHGAKFQGDTNFRSATFLGYADFHSTKYFQEASFSDVHFNQGGIFREAEFSQKADFSHSIFSIEAHFSSTQFKNQVSFNSVEFRKGASFYQTKFLQTAEFHNTNFSEEASFYAAKFNDQAEFGKATFLDVADFNTAEFKSVAEFALAKFGGQTRFSFTQFADEADFKSATFKEMTNFSSASFGGDANFGSATFHSPVYFDNASFAGEAGFSHTSFKDVARFSSNERMMFADSAALNLEFARIDKPERVAFHGLELHPHWFVNVDCRKFDFLDVRWLNVINWSRTYSPKAELLSLADKVSAPHRLLSVTYRQLAVNAEENHRYGEALKLRYASMETHRLEIFRGFTPWKLNWWYWLASGYGESAVRAFLVFVALIAVFTFGYTKTEFDHSSRILPVIETLPRTTNSTSKPIDSRPLELKDAFVYSLNVAILQKPEPKPSSFAAKLLVWLETVLGPAQAALLALAVRRRFMR